MIRLSAWTISTAVSYFVAPKEVTITLATAAIADTASRVGALYARVTLPPRIEPPEKKEWASSIVIPGNIQGMSVAALKPYNEGNPIQFSVQGGGRIVISIDAEKTTEKNIQGALNLIHEHYPQVWKIEIFNYLSEGEPLIDAIGQFSCLGSLSLKNCQTLKEEVVYALLEKNRSHAKKDPSDRIKQVDLEGSGCNPNLDKYNLIYKKANGDTNADAQAELFYQTVKQHTRKTLLLLVQGKKKQYEQSFIDLEKQSHLGDLISLEAMLKAASGEMSQSSRRISELIKKLRFILDPTEMDPDTKRKVIHESKAFAQTAVGSPLIGVLDNPLCLDMRNWFVTDEMAEPFFIIFQSLNAYLTRLYISETYVTGNFLKWASGLPVETLIACRLKKLDPKELKHLRNFSSLHHLDLSGSPVTNEGLIVSIRLLPSVRFLLLNHCTLINDSALMVTVAGLMHTLEYLSIENAPQITIEGIQSMMARGDENMSKPFVLTYTFEEKRSLAISGIQNIDSKLVETLRKLKKGGKIKSLNFGSKSALNRRDLEEGLYTLPFLEIDTLHLEDVAIEDDALPTFCKRWPIQRVHLTNGEITVQEDAVTAKGTDMTNDFFLFLEGVETFRRLDLHFDRLVDSLGKIGDLCKKKGVCRLTLWGADITNDAFELLSNSPNKIARALLSSCKSIHLEETAVQNLFKRWNCDLEDGDSCTIHMGDGTVKTFEHQESSE